MATKAKSPWFGKVAGHVTEAKNRWNQDKLERKIAGELPPSENIILTEDEISKAGGVWDAGRVLWTTLDGKPRIMTASDLRAFQRNMEAAKRAIAKQAAASLKDRGIGTTVKGVKIDSGRGIRPRDVIELSTGRPLNYVGVGMALYGGAMPQYKNDLDKARNEITMALPVSALNNEIRFITNAGKDSKVSRHNVVVKLELWAEAMSRLARIDANDEKKVRAIANWLRKQRISFDCDCERHRYFFRYLATLGDFHAGRPETGFPKIRNPHLQGCACKHVLRVMAELESSTVVLNFLTKHLMSVKNRMARTTLTQKQAEEANKKRRKAAINDRAARKAMTAKATQARTIKAAQKKKVRPPKKQSPAMRKFLKAVSAMEKTMGKKMDERTKNMLAASFGVTL